MDSLLDDLISKVNFDKEEVGAPLTQSALASFRHRGEVRPVGVVFEQRFTEEQAAWLQRLPRQPGFREAAYRLMAHVAAESQRDVHQWLKDPRQVNDHFGECPAACFETDRHVIELPALNMILTLATPSLIERLWSDPSVLAVVPDIPIDSMHDDEVQLLGDTDHPVPGLGPEGYPWGWQRLQAPKIHQEVRGKGMRLGIVDAYVSDAHADLKGKIAEFVQFQLPGQTQPAHSLDPRGHGTHMAGIMVGGNLADTESGRPRIGGAPEAELVAACAVHEDPAHFSHALSGIEWMVKPERRVRVINLSIGIKGPSPEQTICFDAILQRAQALEVVLVAAIGNRAGRSCWPARSPAVLGVGAIDEQRTVWEKSGERPDVVAPGVKILSCLPSGLPAFRGAAYCCKTGTSPAAAHISALAGLVMQTADQASAELVMEALKNTADRAGGVDNRYGHGVPDYFAAVKYIQDRLRHCP